jgi:hypothetical protein
VIRINRNLQFFPHRGPHVRILTIECMILCSEKNLCKNNCHIKDFISSKFRFISFSKIREQTKMKFCEGFLRLISLMLILLCCYFLLNFTKLVFSLVYLITPLAYFYGTALFRFMFFLSKEKHYIYNKISGRRMCLCVCKHYIYNKISGRSVCVI